MNRGPAGRSCGPSRSPLQPLCVHMTRRLAHPDRTGHPSCPPPPAETLDTGFFPRLATDPQGTLCPSRSVGMWMLRSGAGSEGLAGPWAPRRRQAWLQAPREGCSVVDVSRVGAGGMRVGGGRLGQ